MRLQMLLAALATTIGVAVGYFGRPHWPPPPKFVNVTVVSVNDHFTAVVLVNDRGETEQHGYVACASDPVCRAIVTHLMDTGHIDFVEIEAHAAPTLFTEPAPGTAL